MKKIIVYTLAFLHLSIVSLTIFHGLSDYNTYGFLEKPLGALTTINYSAWRFGFFTPNVGNSTEVKFVLRNPLGEEIIHNTSDGFDFFTSNLESANRFYGHKVHSAKDSLFLDLSARSMCAFMLNEHEGMNYISMSMKGIRYPTMKNFRKDSVIKMNEYYRVEFELY